LIVVAPPVGASPSTLGLDAFRVAKAVEARLAASRARGDDALFATVTRNGGTFALAGAAPDAIDPVAGGLAGLAKTAAAEWGVQGVTVRAVDLASDFADVAAAAARVAEALLAHGPLETGLAAEADVTLQLVRRDVAADAPAPVAPGDVVVVTGGARGITAELVQQMAKQWRPTLVLLGRQAEPAPEATWLAGIASEKDLKAAIARHEDGLSARELAQRYAEIMAAREMRATFAALRRSGLRFQYHAVDAVDAGAVATLLGRVRRELGPVRGLVHGAGVLDDRLIRDKTEDGFRRVYATKVHGFTSLLAAVDASELKLVFVLSSSTARFGRRGQVDYAVANEVLNKHVAALKAARPELVAGAGNFGPWDGGMVTPALKALFAAERIAVIPRASGAREVVAALPALAGQGVETVVLGGGSHVEAAPRRQAASAESGDLALRLDLAAHAFLASHVIGGKCVLPAAVMMDWLAQAALATRPGAALAGLEDFYVAAGVRFEPTAHADLAFSVGDADGDVVAVSLYDVTSGERRLAARADVRLAAAPAEPSTRAPSELAHVVHAPFADSPALVYADLLFHGRDLQGIERIQGLSERGVEARLRAAPTPAQWMRAPRFDGWRVDPLVLDGVFQLVTVWCLRNRGVACLPSRVAGYRPFVERFPSTPVTAHVDVKAATASQITVDVDLVGEDGLVVAALRGVQSVVAESIFPAFDRPGRSAAPRQI
jgi:NAD(P)-dependent dehydrogenase (short-subunit alcohol dehydrogenase family)